MKIPEANLLVLTLDLILKPFMMILNGFKKPFQESHKWHAINVSPTKLSKNKSLFIKGYKLKAKFDHESPMGLLHMPIFGGITKYVVVETKGYKGHWHIIWKGKKCQIHRLAIKEPRLKLLASRGGFEVYGIDDSGKILDMKLAGEGEIGDGKFSGIRLF